MVLVLVFSFALISPTFAQILKYIAQYCDCMIAAFIKSAFRWLAAPPTWGWGDPGCRAGWRETVNGLPTLAGTTGWDWPALTLAENWTGRKLDWQTVRLSDCQTVRLSHCQTVTGLPTQAGTTGWDWPAITLAEHRTGRLSDCQTGRLWLDCLHWQRNYRVIQASSYTVRKLDWQNLEYQSLGYHNLEF